MAAIAKIRAVSSINTNCLLRLFLCVFIIVAALKLFETNTNALCKVGCFKREDFRHVRGILI